MNTTVLQRITDKKEQLDRVKPLSQAVLAQFDAWYDVELTYTSNAIEGNTLTRQETAIVIEKGITVRGKPLKDHVAVVDRHGSTKVLLKADGSGPHTVGSCTGKAFTAASMGRNMRGLANFMNEHRGLDGLRLMDARLVILAGGLPIRIDGTLLGGIGVGGAPSGDMDESCAQAGIAATGGEWV